MSRESDFLLGIAFGLLTQVRQHLIEIGDVDGVKLIEDEYIKLREGIQRTFYGDRNDG